MSRNRIGLIIAGVLGLLVLYWATLPVDFVVGRDSETDIAGAYTVNGISPNGIEYSGTVFIFADGGRDGDGGSNVYSMQWLITGTIQEGTAVKRGEVLDVEWESVSAAGDDPGRGRAEYIIEDDGRMTGTRFVDGLEEAATEELFPEA
jgi:hypothetical protein